MKSENFITHFIRHIKEVISSKISRAIEFPIQVHEKYHRLKDEIKRIKNAK